MELRDRRPLQHDGLRLCSTTACCDAGLARRLAILLDNSSAVLRVVLRAAEMQCSMTGIAGKAAAKGAQSNQGREENVGAVSGGWPPKAGCSTCQKSCRSEIDQGQSILIIREEESFRQRMGIFRNVQVQGQPPRVPRRPAPRDGATQASAIGDRDASSTGGSIRR